MTFPSPQLALGGSVPAGDAAMLAARTGIDAVVDLGLEACHGARALSAQVVAFARRRVERGGKVLVHCDCGIGRSATLAPCALVATGIRGIGAALAGMVAAGARAGAPLMVRPTGPPFRRELAPA